MDRSLVARAAYATVGVLCVIVGLVGVVVPVLPSTGPLVAAAWCFSRSSRRMEQWVLGLPKVGPLVRDYRAGMGMPRHAKLVAIGSIVVACAVSAGLALDSWAWRVLVVVLGAIGCAVVWRVPTAPPSESRASPVVGDAVE